MTAKRDRSEYFKERRKGQKTFSVTIDRERLEQFEAELQKKGLTKTSWLEAQINEVLGK